MKFHQTQALVAADNTQYRIVDCGRQWGKTTLAVWEMTACAYSKGGRRVAYYATTFGQARNIAWQMLKDATRTLWVKPPNESRLELYIRSQDGGVSEIYLFGFESVETARGQQFDLIVLDEVAKMRNFKEGWEGALLGTLAFREGKALFISTPYGFNHFFDLYELGQSSNPLYKSWRFTSFDNPFLKPEYLHGIESTVTTDFWSQEYLADFRRFTGLIYKEFDLEQHVRLLDHEFNQYGDYYYGLDFAVRGYTASLAIFINPDGVIHILDEYKVDNLTAEVHSEAIRNMLTKHADFEKWTGYADPAGFAKNQQKGEMLWAIADEYMEAGFAMTRANNEVVSGINYVRQLFKAGKIVINPKCTMLIDELLQYQWKAQPDTNKEVSSEPEAVRKVNDHLVDSMRYALYSKPDAPDEEIVKSPLVFPAVFPMKLDVENEEEEKFELLESSDPYETLD